MYVLGIDLGTTNSLITVQHQGKVRCIPNALGSDLTPSVVGLDDDGSVLVGATAKQRLVSHPDLTASVFKRDMGTDTVVQLGKREFRAEELSALVLRSLKADAEAFLGETVEDVVISVPAYFHESQRRATRNAALLAGLKPVRLVNEPTAASIAYAVGRLEEEGTCLVLDLGGGTFDVTILELFERTMEVRASAGDSQLGGEDFAKRLADLMLKENGIDPVDLSAGDKAVVARMSEAAKIELTDGATTLVECRIHGRDLAWPVSRDGFEGACGDLWSRLLLPVERALSDARLKPQDIGEVLLVGGATRMPRIRTLTRKLFGKEPRTDIDPDRVVAIGAGVQAALVATNDAFGDVVMTDVCPWSLGLDLAEDTGGGSFTTGHFHPLIERNRTIPVSVSENLSALRPGQKLVELEVYQGESRQVANNKKLGTIQVKLPPKSKVKEIVEVRFTYTVDGILEVEARVDGSETPERLVIQQTPGLLGEEEIARRLTEIAHLKTAPRERAEYRDLLARLDAHFAMSLKERRQQIALAMRIFEAALGSQDEDRFRPVARQIRAFLKQLDEDRGVFDFPDSPQDLDHGEDQKG